MTKAKLILILVSILTIINSRQFGLLSKDGRPVQLLTLHTKALIEGPYTEIQQTHVYTNPYDSSLETEFYFPRTEASVFYEFQAVLNDRVIIGEILEKQEAKQKYDWNVQRGNTVAYAEKNTMTPDVMQVLVGNIPPNETIQIKFSIIQPLEAVASRFWGLTLPSVLTERYSPASISCTSQIPNIQNVELDDSVYREWKLDVEVKADSMFTHLINPSHHIQPNLLETKSGPFSKIYTAIWHLTTTPDKDFVIYFRTQNTHTPTTILAEHTQYPNDYVLMVNFLPQLNTLDLDVVQQKLEAGSDGMLDLNNLALEEDTRNSQAEFIFVIDRSGSMMGSRIVNLQRALTKFLQILPRNSFFNIISFGSSFAPYQKESIKYTTSSMEDAVRWIGTISADMGGTEILPCLKHIIDTPLIQGYPRTVIVLTDGDVYNPNQIIHHTLSNSDRMRFCAVGIGYGASEYLVKNLGKAGKCTSEFVLDNEDVGDKTEYIVKAAVSRSLQNITIHTQCYDGEQRQVFVETKNLGFILKNTPFGQWIYLTDIEDIPFCELRVEYYDSLKNERVEINLKEDGFEMAEKTDVWHKVAYNSRMKELDLQAKFSTAGMSVSETNQIKADIVRFSIKYQVLSDYTSFLAVVQENVKVDEQDRVKVLIPSAESHDHHNVQGRYPETIITTSTATGTTTGTTAGTGIGTGTITGTTTGTITSTGTGTGTGIGIGTGTTTGTTTGTITGTTPGTGIGTGTTTGTITGTTAGVINNVKANNLESQRVSSGSYNLGSNEGKKVYEVIYDDHNIVGVSERGANPSNDAAPNHAVILVSLLSKILSLVTILLFIIF